MDWADFSFPPPPAEELSSSLPLPLPLPPVEALAASLPFGAMERGETESPGTLGGWSCDEQRTVLALRRESRRPADGAQAVKMGALWGSLKVSQDHLNLKAWRAKEGQGQAIRV